MSANPPDTSYVIDSPTTASANAPVEDDKPDVSELQAQIDELNRQIAYEAKLREAAEDQSKFWFDAANRKVESAPPPQQQSPPPLEEPKLTEERYNAILSDPSEMTKYIEEVADYKARVISGEVATQVADAKADQIRSSQARLQSAWNGEVQRLRGQGISFGTVGEPFTELFQQKVNAMMQDPQYADIDPVIGMRIAISQAEADFLRSGGQLGQPEEDEQVAGQPTKSTPPQFPRTLNPQQKQQRDAAIAAQSPSKGRKAAPPEKFSNIPADQMALLEKHARGLGVTVDKIVEQMPRVTRFRK